MPRAAMIASATGQAGGQQNLWQPAWAAETMIKSTASSNRELFGGRHFANIERVLFIKRFTVNRDIVLDVDESSSWERLFAEGAIRWGLP